MRIIVRGNKFIVDNSAKEFRANEKIMAPELMVIDEEGNSLGIITREEAMTEARNRELDLVEVSPKAQPPIAKFMDYGSFKYQREKQERKAKANSKAVEIKTIKLSLRIGQHDIDFRTDQAAKFIDGGDKVRIELMLRGRENQHQDLARENVEKIIAGVKTILAETGKSIRIEQEVKKQGNILSTVIAPS